MKAKQWQSPPLDTTAVDQLIAACGLPRPICALLAARGFSAADPLDDWLSPRLSRLSDPLQLPDMPQAVERLACAVRAGETVLVYGDYDVDGITSTALMIRVLRALGVPAIPYLPHRVDDGYGLSLEPVQRCIAEHAPGCIVTVDCGTGSVEAVTYAQAQGVDVIITDHHEPGAAIAPACAVVNPKRLPAESEHRVLAGVGVAFKLCHALLKHLRDEEFEAAARIDLRTHLDLVAVGTIADMVPLTDENRILARYGLVELNRTTKAGFLALREVAKIQGDIETYHVGFLLGPRLNAAGRLGTAQQGLDLLLTEDPDIAAGLAEQLDQANRQRQQVEARIVDEAMALIEADYVAEQHYAVIAAQRDWHPGVIGIVASRLCQKYHRPAIVIAIDETGLGRGSCRSIAPFNIADGLAACTDCLIQHGGHAMAAGLQVQADQIGPFMTRFQAVAREQLTADQLQPVQRIDAWLSLREADWTLIECLERMAPFGLGNPKPVWGIKGGRLFGAPRVVGEKHLKCTVLHDNAKVDAIAFNMADREWPDGPLDFAFQLSRNRWAGRETIQMTIQDIRPSST